MVFPNTEDDMTISLKTNDGRNTQLSAEAAAIQSRMCASASTVDM